MWSEMIILQRTKFSTRDGEVARKYRPFLYMLCMRHGGLVDTVDTLLNSIKNDVIHTSFRHGHGTAADTLTPGKWHRGKFVGRHRFWIHLGLTNITKTTTATTAINQSINSFRTRNTLHCDQSNVYSSHVIYVRVSTNLIKQNSRKLPGGILRKIQDMFALLQPPM